MEVNFRVGKRKKQKHLSGRIGKCFFVFFFYQGGHFTDILLHLNEMILKNGQNPVLSCE